MASIRLPGFGLPLDYTPSRGHYARNERDHEPADDVLSNGLFPNLLNTLTGIGSDLGLMLPLTTLREFTMMHLMNEVTDKPNWHKKINDPNIVTKWREEMLSGGDSDVSERMADWCIEELRYKAKIFEETGAISVYTGDVVKSDTAVPSHLNQMLKAAVVPLEDVPSRQRDWHPDSDEKVLDLVHPSLFPLIYGRSKILSRGQVDIEDCIRKSGSGVTVPVPSGFGSDIQWGVLRKPFSRDFQWLPSDVDITDPAKPSFMSYVNNLHPVKHKDLYSVIEQILACVIPLWNMSLTPLKARTVLYPRIGYTTSKYNPKYGDIPHSEGPQQEEGEHRSRYSYRRYEWYTTIRRVAQPEPPSAFKPFWVPETVASRILTEDSNSLKPEKMVDLGRDYDDEGIQVIVKLANIHLTPDKPEYAGGSWHVEGQLNEHICASAVYYYDSVNITTSRLAFRQQSNVADARAVNYEQDHHDWLKVVFGCEQNGSGLQNVGSVATPEGRLLVWPNILQHQVQPFRLADPSKPGHRKILAFFLVDPNIRIISTANVPCQRRDWWSEMVMENSNAISSLPVELQDCIFDEVEDFPLSLEEAKRLRLILMAERKAYVADYDSAIKEETFSLCEH